MALSFLGSLSAAGGGKSGRKPTGRKGEKAEALPAGQGETPPLPRNYVAVARGPGFVLLRVVGLGNMQTAPALAAFAEGEQADGCRRFIFDLVECRGFDSTFMGCMVGLATALRRVSSRLEVPPPEKLELCASATVGSALKPEQPAAEEPEPLNPEEAAEHLRRTFDAAEKSSGGVFVLNISDECRKLLGSLGVDKFVKLGGRADLSALETTPLPAYDCSPEERRRLIFEAHTSLVEIDRRNQERFGAFLSALSAELAQRL